MSTPTSLKIASALPFQWKSWSKRGFCFYIIIMSFCRLCKPNVPAYPLLCTSLPFFTYQPTLAYVPAYPSSRTGMPFLTYQPTLPHVLACPSLRTGLLFLTHRPTLPACPSSCTGLRFLTYRLNLPHVPAHHSYVNRTIIYVPTYLLSRITYPSLRLTLFSVQPFPRTSHSPFSCARL